MVRKIGRNDPCPCGSGKKHKKCCLKRDTALREDLGPISTQRSTDRFRFEPGAYGQPERGYFSAILCREQVDGDWRPNFLLANPVPLDDWPLAAKLANLNLDSAFDEKMETGSDKAAALKLETLGYKSVSSYRLKNFRPFEAIPDSETELDSSPLGLDERSPAQAALFGVVEEQIRTGEPKETGLTFQRLLDSGHNEDQAKELIAILVAAEIYGMTHEEREFDLQLYEKNLRRLPELPEHLRG